jgi:glutamate/tyrosine decarboxylase-like PLP-dependent enzyme
VEDHGKAYRDALDRAHEHALHWLDTVQTRPLPDDPTDPAVVIDELARVSEPGLMAMPSGRFYGWVIGGTLPAALAADWLVSAWDQNAGMRYATPASAAVEEAAGVWLLDLLGLPPTAGVGFTTGATMANFVGLAAGRRHVLDQVGWDLDTAGLAGAPRITVLVGQDRHTSVDLALRYLGLGAPVAVAVDQEGRLRPDALAEAMAGITGPSIVCLQAGNLHSGAFDPMRAAIEVARGHGAWVHVDGAFGLWAAASPRYRDHLDGLDTADSWATDAHKTLNVPYDCGIAIVARTDVLRSTFGTTTSYLVQDDHGRTDPFDRVPELSRRARGTTVWAALRSLGRSGTVALVDRLAGTAQALATGLARIPGVEVLNEVVFTQVCLSFGSDERTRQVTKALIEDGTVWMSGSRWHGRDVLRISVSNWSTGADDIAASIAAVERAAASVPA